MLAQGRASVCARPQQAWGIVCVCACARVCAYVCVHVCVHICVCVVSDGVRGNNFCSGPI